MFTSAVKVRTAYESRRTDLMLGVDYNTDLSKAVDLLYSLIPDVEGVLSYIDPEIDIVNFGDSSIDLVVRYWTSPQQKIVRQIQTQMIISIKDAFDKASISIPYPIRTLYYYDQDKYSDSQPKSNESIRNKI